MQMSEDHKIDEDPHLEDQLTIKISPEKKTPTQKQVAPVLKEEIKE